MKEPEQQYSPKDIVASGLCIGCGACVAQVDAGIARMQFDEQGELKPHGPESWYSKPTDQFSRTCPFSPLAKNEDELAAAKQVQPRFVDPSVGLFESAWVGHVAEMDYRQAGSSGGMVSWVAAELLQRGLIDGVAHVVVTDHPQQEGAFFKFTISTSKAGVCAGSKSRYYPVEMSAVLQQMADTPGRYAIVGIPCFIKAIQLMRHNSTFWREKIAFTLGLFCGHMKSAHFVESMAAQVGFSLEELRAVEYRYKQPGRPANWYTAMLTRGNGEQRMIDWWQMGDGDWGAGFFMNHTCNFCDDVMSETADISFGDAWVEPYASDEKGTNVVVVRSKLLHQIFLEAIAANRIQAVEVDAALVAQTQAAGLRQRREGLAYRLTWKWPGVVPPKRVKPDELTVTSPRKRLYRLRYHIATRSLRLFQLARKWNMPWLYRHWSRLVGAFYYCNAYHKGSVKAFWNRWKGFYKQQR